MATRGEEDGIWKWILDAPNPLSLQQRRWSKQRETERESKSRKKDSCGLPWPVGYGLPLPVGSLGDDFFLLFFFFPSTDEWNTDWSCAATGARAGFAKTSPVEIWTGEIFSALGWDFDQIVGRSGHGTRQSLKVGPLIRAFLGPTFSRFLSSH